MTVRTLLLALSLAVLPLSPAWRRCPPGIDGADGNAQRPPRGISATSIAVIDENSGKVVHFMLEAPFEDAFAANEKVQIPMNELRTNSTVRVDYDQNRGGRAAPNASSS